MKKPLELKSPEGKVLRPGSEQKDAAQTVLQRAEAALAQGEELARSVARPRTKAEHRLTSATAKLRLFMHGLGLIGALGVGGAAVHEGAERAGEELQRQAVTVGNTVRSILNPRLIDTDQSAHPDTLSAPATSNQDRAGYVSWTEDLEIAPTDAAQSINSDATVPSSDITSQEQHQQTIIESAIQLADEFQSEDLLAHIRTPTAFQSVLEQRLNEMGITGTGNVETARLAITQRYREQIQEEADQDIEAALRKADHFNAVFGTFDTYQLALQHNRTDLAAERATRHLSDYSDNLRDIRRDSSYADDEEGRRSALSDLQRDLVRTIFPAQQSDRASETLRQLSREDRHQLAQALDGQITDLERDTSEGARVDEAELERLRGFRRLL